MYSELTDFETVLGQVREPASKLYFRDAVRSYNAGILRPAITSAWTALVFDLILKYRELAVLGDAEAINFLSAWDNAQKNQGVEKLLKLEGQILDHSAEKLEIIQSIESRHLKRLREDRHLCSHPAFSDDANLFMPSAELVRMHLWNVANFVLIRAPMQGRYLFERFSVDLSSPGFPNNYQATVEYVEEKYLRRIRQSNLKNFGVVLAKFLIFGTPKDWTPHWAKIINSLFAFQHRMPHIWPETAEAIVQIINNSSPKERPAILPFLTVFPGFWDKIEQHHRIAIEETVSNLTPKSIEDFRQLRAVMLPEFEDRILRIINSLDSIQLSEAVALEAIDHYIPRAIFLFGESSSFREAEANFSELIMPFAGRLSKLQLSKIIQSFINNAQIREANLSPQLLSTLLLNTQHVEYPDKEERSKFSKSVAGLKKGGRYDAIIEIFKFDGWTPPLHI